jgi:hypothetical protein
MDSSVNDVTEQSDEFGQLMMALGSIVVMWGMVEDVTRAFTSDVVFENDADPNIERIILSEMPFRGQLDILKKVAHVRRGNTDWYERLLVQIVALSGPLHAKRNRFIHDLWEKNEQGQMIKYVRGKEETAIKKTGGEWHLTLTGEQTVPVAEVEAFFEEAADAFEAMLKLKSEYVELRLAEIKKEILDKIRRRPSPMKKDGGNILGRLLGDASDMPQ